MVDLSLLRGQDACLGFFDGLHRGHQELLRHARKPFLLTFSADLALTKKTVPLLTAEEKEFLLRRWRIPSLALPFSLVKEMDASTFASLLKSAEPRKIVVGEDFRFGKDRRGSASDLRNLLDGIPVEIVPLLSQGGDKVSSARIRLLLSEGRIEEANALLGYPFFVLGKVLHGKENGRRIGFPTANLEQRRDKIALPTGVYGTRCLIEGREYRSMTNIGSHPTVDRLDRRTIETHVLSFQGDLYGRSIVVGFERFLRPQRKFSSLEELREQLLLDREEVDR